MLDPALRRNVRDAICDAIERLYEDKSLKIHAHLTLQAAIDEVEDIFAVPAAGRPDKPTAG
jgi:uncharacterized protein (UPF0147 family)